EKINDIEFGLSTISEVIDKQLESVGLGHIKSHFKIPENSLKNLFSSFEYHLSDPVQTEIERKGMGIQSAAMLASFKWISSEEKRQGRTPIWLVEEPESYLHPELSTACNSMLCSLSEQAHLVTTTHSLGFVPQDPKKLIGTKLHEGYTQVYEFDTYTKATKTIRDSLGVKFSDFCNLGLLNVFVEGKTDRELFQWALDKIPVQASGKYTWDNVRNAEFLDFGGTSALEGFMKATYEYVSKERPVVVILDGDEAGDKTRKSLQQFLGKKGIKFQCDEQFIILPRGFAIEGLFPHEWIIEANEKHPSWIKDFSTDLNDQLMPFTAKDEAKKSQLREFLKRKVDEQTDDIWAKSFINLFEKIDHALELHKI
ncbi:AAA family ATPase, partial [Vibrio vulnificus]|nr:AAA family ATPase [Vibrio vulnificus]